MKEHGLLCSTGGFTSGTSSLAYNADIRCREVSHCMVIQFLGLHFCCCVLLLLIMVMMVLVG
jgi:hypothetical protein